MNYDAKLADRIREYLEAYPRLKVEEKTMFGGLAFMVNGKMCVNVSGKNLMCRFDQRGQKEVEARVGFQPVIMKGRKFNGYCYVAPEGFRTKKDFEYWLNLCLDFNEKAKSSKKEKVTILARTWFPKANDPHHPTHLHHSRTGKHLPPV